MTTAVPTRAEERMRLRSDIELAGRVLAPSWPLETFIAVNPLGGLEDRPFDQALADAGELFGARGTLGEPVFRALHRAGRITDADLIGALEQRCPGPLREPDVDAADRSLSAARVLLTDLLSGVPGPGPVRRALMRSELLEPRVAQTVDALTAKWCAAFLDAGQAAWPMPGREHGFYDAWRSLAPLDRALGAGARDALADLPATSEDAALDGLAALGIAAGGRRRYLQAHLTRLPGWAAHVRWRSEHGAGIDLIGFLAMRLAYEAALLGDLADARAADTPGPDGVVASAIERAEHVARELGAPHADLDALAALLERLPVADRTMVWLEAYEAHHRDPLLCRLSGQPAAAAAARPTAQLVCCIDARSEGLRRHLEGLGGYDTLGFAGFFAVAIRFQDLAGGAPSALCPVLLEPRTAIVERPVDGAQALADRRLAGHHVLAGAEESFHAAKDDVLAPFALAESAGWIAGPLAAGKTLLAGPYGALRANLQRRATPPAPTALSVQSSFSAAERELFAEVALTMMGLTSGFARLVLLCGHGSTTENNPYEAALDCGACGGNRGAPNARVAAAILNGEDVRTHLATQGIDLPADTWFVAAEHDTATDRVTVLDPWLVPDGHRDELTQLERDLAEAGARLSAERCADLPGAPRGMDPQAAARHARARSTDWAQVFPEFGLAGNAAFIVGPRAITRGIDLQRRAFLHSYDAAVDRDGAALETILTAPLVVAQWINCQYYFSTVDPEVFGAGSKTIHNVVGGIGVLSGHNGDLQLGLPWQSLSDGERLIHEPMRLLAIVQAPLERIDAIVDRNAVLQRLFGNGWVALAAREQPADPWQRHTRDGWSSWSTQHEEI